MNIKELRQRKADLSNEGQELLTAAERESRGLTRTEEAAYNAIKVGLQDTEQQIIAWEKNLAKDRAQGGYGVSDELIPEKPPAGPGRSGRRYVELFGPPTDSGSFENYDEFLKAVTSHRGDQRLQAAIFAASGEKFPSEGGFLVPQEFAAEMLDAALENEIVRPRAQVTGMTSASKKVSGVDVSSPTSSFGAEAEWLKESGSGTVRTMRVRAIELHARKLALFAASSNELVADGVSFEEQLNGALIKGLSWGLDLAFLSGDGAGKPQGILKSPALITVGKETGQLANTIVYENLANIFARLHPGSMSNAIWVANNSAIPQLLQITIGVGTGGTHFPVLRENGGRFFIFTREVLFTEKLPAIGTVGDIILADFSQYTIGLRKEISLDRSMHVGFAKDETNYRSIVRADGQGRWAKAYTPKNGDTLSPFVALATRS